MNEIRTFVIGVILVCIIIGLFFQQCIISYIDSIDCIILVRIN